MAETSALSFQAGMAYARAVSGSFFHASFGLGSLLLAAAWAGVGSATETVRFEHLTTGDGLSQGHITSIAQDRQGFIWFGTQDGLHRYDGHELKVFKHDPRDSSSLADSYILDLMVDAQGQLWVATNNGGLHRANPELGSFERIDYGEGSASGLGSGTINALSAGADGTLWVSSKGGGLCSLAPGHPRFECFEDRVGLRLGSGDIGATLLASDGVLWAEQTGIGLTRLDPETGEAIVDQSYGATSCLLEDSLGRIWAGSYGAGLFRFEDGRMMSQAELFPGGAHLRITELLQASSGEIWVGTADSGLFILSLETGEVLQLLHDERAPSSLRGNSVGSLFEDEAGTVWVGSEGSGLSRFSPYRFKFDLHPIFGEGNASFVYAIHESQQGTLWSGGGAAGLVEHRPGEDAVIHELRLDDRPVSATNIMAIEELDDGTLLLGSSRLGLLRYHPGTGRTERIGPEVGVHALARSATGVWIGLDHEGLAHQDLRSGEMRRWGPDDTPLPQGLIGTLLVGHDGVLWIGTSHGGLLSYDPGTDRFVRYRQSSEPNGLVDDSVLSLHEDAEGILWVGTRGGLTRLDPSSGETVDYHEVTSLPNGVIYGILPDDEGYLWLSCNKGLVRFDPRGGPLRHYTEGDGLQDDEFNRGAAFRGRDGRLYFGGVNGISSFHPGSLRDNPEPPRLTLTSYRLFNGSSLRVPAGGLRLSYNEHAFDIEFAALDYAAPERNLYSYMLEGYDPHWSAPSARRGGSWTRVPPGEYTLRVRASNNDGVWTREGDEVTLPVIIVPPPWRRLPVQALAVLSLLALVGGAVLARLRSLHRQRDRLIEEVERRTAELAHMSRTDLLTGVANRKSLLEIGAAEVHRAHRQDSNLAALRIDLDRFAQFNELRGREAGDAALRELARILGQLLRPFDTLGRLEEDELLVLLPSSTLGAALGVASRIRQGLAGQGLGLTASIGVVQLAEEEGFDAMMLRAGQALAQAKEKGRDRAAVG